MANKNIHVQNSEQRDALIKALDNTVMSPNEIDFCAFVKLNTIAGDNPLLLHCSKQNKGREVELDWVEKISYAEGVKYETAPFSTLRIEQTDTTIMGWLPIWNERAIDQRKHLYIGSFILYISSTPVGKDIFNIAIQTDGREHIQIARQFLDTLQSG